jgi:hypothetical protein
VYAYQQYCYEAHERIKRREREAEAERQIRQCRAHRRWRRGQIAAALGKFLARRRKTELKLDL